MRTYNKNMAQFQLYKNVEFLHGISYVDTIAVTCHWLHLKTYLVNMNFVHIKYSERKRMTGKCPDAFQIFFKKCIYFKGTENHPF